jgi:Zn-dependent protease with chaperone function
MGKECAGILMERFGPPLLPLALLLLLFLYLSATARHLALITLLSFHWRITNAVLLLFMFCCFPALTLLPLSFLHRCCSFSTLLLLLSFFLSFFVSFFSLFWAQALWVAHFSAAQTAKQHLKRKTRQNWQPLWQNKQRQRPSWCPTLYGGKQSRGAAISTWALRHGIALVPAASGKTPLFQRNKA